jgi:phage gp29-like protein
MSEKPLLWLPGNRPYNPTAPPVEAVAAIGQVWDPFATRHFDLDVNPESIARALRGDYPLARKQALAKRVLRNDTAFAGAYRNLSVGVSGLDWECVARDKKLRKDQRIAERVRDYVQQQLEELPVEQFVQHMVDGEYSPGAWAENQWDLRSKELRGWELLDGERQHYDRQLSSYRVLTLAEPSRGEELPANMWAIHTSRLFPGGVLDCGLWSPVLWQYCWKHFAIADWLEFNAVYGKPWRLAFVRDPKDLQSVIKALKQIGVNGAGAFPAGTEVRLEAGSSSGSIDIFDKLASRADDEVSTLFTGHDLITRSKAGAGTLAGKGAMTIHEKVLRKVCRGIMTTKHRDVIVPMVTFKFGYDVAREYTSPQTWRLKYEPPKDQVTRARALVMVNKDLLAPIGKAIGEQQILEEFGIAEVVDRPQAAPPAAPADPSDDTAADADGEEKEEASRRRSGRELAAAKASTALTSIDAIQDLGAAVGQRAFAAVGAQLEQSIDAAEDTFTAMAAAIWEDYGEMRRVKRRMASAARDVLLVANVAGQGDVHAGD